jgi:hypothetical protein
LCRIRKRVGVVNDGVERAFTEKADDAFEIRLGAQRAPEQIFVIPVGVPQIDLHRIAGSPATDYLRPTATEHLHPGTPNGLPRRLRV